MISNHLRRLLILGSFIITFALQNSYAETPNYAVSPTALSVGLKGQKSTTQTFNVLQNSGPYQLIIKNGSGQVFPKQTCAGNLVKKLLCLASNLIADLKTASERVVSAEILLNGKTVVSAKELNITVTSLNLPVELNPSNQLQIKVVGFPSAYLTYEIRGKSVPTLSGTLAITSPIGETTTDSYSINITGKVTSSASNLRLLFNNSTEIPGVTSGGNFSYRYDTLNPGLNTRTISLYSGTTLLDSKELNIITLLPGSAGGLLSSSGGAVSISDGTSDLYGSSIEVPSGALQEPEYLVLQHGDDWGPDLPFSATNIGPIVSTLPFLQEFSQNVTITIPYDFNKMPNGAVKENIKIYAYDGDSWKIIEPTKISSSSVSIQANIFNYYALQAAIETPLLTGDLQILANVSGATIYVDGLFRGDLTPSTISSISNGSHSLKIYAPGHNEIQQSIEYPAQRRISLELLPQDSSAPSVKLDSELTDGMIVYDNLISIEGQISLNSDFSNQGFVVLSQNSRDISQPLSSDGKFSFVIPLFNGDNFIQVRATVNGNTGLSQEIKIIQSEQTTSFLRSALSMNLATEGDLASKLEQDPKSVKIRNQKLSAFPKSRPTARSSFMALDVDDDRIDKAIKVVVTWDKNDTDIDTHIYDDYGGHAWYDDLTGISQGTLDRDDVDGFGPEIFTLSRPRPGKYPVQIQYYSDNENGPTTATVKVYLDGETVFQGSRTITNGESWDAYTINLEAISISNVTSVAGKSKEPLPKECDSYSKYSCVNHIFTTLLGESALKVQVTAPESILDSQIHYRLKEKSLNTNMTLTSTGRTIMFNAISKPLVALNNPEKSKRIVFEIVAYTDTGIESAPYYIVQDTRSQIRQEYIDKRNLLPAFARLNPTYSEISDGSYFPGRNFYKFSEMTAFSDFARKGLGIVGKSIGYANLINSEYIRKNPGIARLELTSGWRNPRRNDKLLGSSTDSFHQSGDSLDLIITRLPDDATLKLKIQHDKNLMNLCEIAFSSTTATDVLYHLGHVHVEPSVGARKKICGTNLKKK